MTLVKRLNLRYTTLFFMIWVTGSTFQKKLFDRRNKSLLAITMTPTTSRIFLQSSLWSMALLLHDSSRFLYSSTRAEQAFSFIDWQVRWQVRGDVKPSKKFGGWVDCSARRARRSSSAALYAQLGDSENFAGCFLVMRRAPVQSGWVPFGNSSDVTRNSKTKFSVEPRRRNGARRGNSAARRRAEVTELCSRPILEIWPP